MDSQKKREEFAISIRRKQTTSKMEALRAMMMPAIEPTHPQTNPKILTEIAKTPQQVVKHLRELKVMSWGAESAQNIYESGAYRSIQITLINGHENLSVLEYHDILTIMINLCVHVQIDISNQTMQVIFKSISKNDLQIISLWFIANIIYQRTQYSMAVAAELVASCHAADFIRNRVTQKFDKVGDIVIFNFFCCSFLVVGSAIPYAEFAKILATIQEIQQFKQYSDENFWFFSEALPDHAQHLQASDYAVLDSPLYARFKDLCKEKKTKFVKNYLKMLKEFTAKDPKAYDQMLRHGDFLNLDYCLENRFPEIRGLCADIGCNLLDNFREKVDTENVGFFAQLATSFLSYEKYPLNVQVSLLKFTYRFFRISAENKSNLEQKKKLIEEVISSKVIETLNSIIVSSNGQFELLALSIGALQNFMDCDEENKIIQKCSEERIPEFLISLETKNEHLYKQIEQFLKNFSVESDMCA